MLSNKWTFSLVSLVVLLAFGLAFFAPSDALGHEAKLHPVKFEGETTSNLVGRSSASRGNSDCD